MIHSSMIHSSCTLPIFMHEKGRLSYIRYLRVGTVYLAVCLVGGRQLAYTAIQDVAVRRHIRHMHARGHKG